MTSPNPTTEFFCEKPCKYCRVTGKCPRLADATATNQAALITTCAEPWYPNREKDTPLRCGCLIPWPIVQAFGQEIHGQIWCSAHGWQPKITQKDIDNARKVAKRKAKQQDQFPDIPPF